MPGVIDQLEIRKLLAFGTGVGIEIRAGNLEAALVRVRPTGIRVLGRVSLRNFRGRPAAEWGAEYAAFLKARGAAYLGATVLLPRQDVIVRQISLPGVIGDDLEAAIALQLDTLHPWGEDEARYGWAQLGKGSVLLGLIRRAVIDQYTALFEEAGIAVSCFTFSAGAVHAAIRMLGEPAIPGFVAVNGFGHAPVEIYGESPDRPLFSAEFDLPLERVMAMAVAELRLDPATEPISLERVLPAPKLNPVENDLSRDALPYATALAAACPRLAPAANLLPVELRASRSRAMFVPTVILAVLLILVAGSLMAYSKVQQRQYLRKLQGQIAQLEPKALHALTLDRRIETTRARSRLLDDFRARPRRDLEALNDLTRMLAPPTWTNMVEMNRESATVSGEAENAAALLSVIDSSRFFHNSEFSMIGKSAGGEIFRVRTLRGDRK